MYNIGQADNLLGSGNVAMPKYEIGSLTKQQYVCDYVLPDNSKKPISIPLGQFNNGTDAYNTNANVNKEDYVEETQQKKAGELSDKWLLIIMVILFCVLATCTYLSFKHQ